jgi:hypothetical protein
MIILVKYLIVKSLHLKDGYIYKTSKNLTRKNRKSISYKITKPQVNIALKLLHLFSFKTPILNYRGCNNIKNAVYRLNIYLTFILYLVLTNLFANSLNVFSIFFLS